MSEEFSLISVLTSLFTSYDTTVPKDHPEFQSEMLEETKKGSIYKKQLEKAGIKVTDQDDDGYLEIKKTDLPKVLQLQSQHVPRLASYFADPKSTTLENRLKGLSGELLEATRTHNFQKARAYFTDLARRSENPLRELGETLARHLSASAMHVGLNVDDMVPLENPNGFSVTRDGRLRFDCGVFAQLAHSDLKGIQGLKFQYITLSTDDNLTLPALTSSISMTDIRISASNLLSGTQPTFAPSSGRGGKSGGHGNGLRARNSVQQPNPELSFEFKIPKPKKMDSYGNHLILLVTDSAGHSLIVDNNHVRYFEGTDPFAKVKKLYSKSYRFFYKSNQFHGSKIKF